MKLSKGKIIFIIIVVYFIVFAVINVNKEKDVNEEILNNVIYINDGIVKPENEGKLVLVSGKISYDSLVSFLELDENFGTIKIKRTVEDYLKDEESGNYSWVERDEPLENNNGDYLKTLVTENKVSNVSIGQFNLDEKGLSLIPTNKYYTDQESINGLITTGIDYSTDPYEEDLKAGDIKLTYKYYDLKNNPYLSVLAVQKGNSFEPYMFDKKTEVYQVYVGEVKNEKDLIKVLDDNVKKTIKGKSLFIILIIGIGIFLIIDNKKK